MFDCSNSLTEISAKLHTNTIPKILAEHLNPGRSFQVGNWRMEWMKKRKDIALNLAKGELGASYGEAVIILCAAISAVSAELHPGKKKDRVRFVELLIKASPLDCGLISVPLLTSFLRHKHKISEAEILETKLAHYQLSQVISTRDVDKPESIILACCPSLELKEIRSCSYAVLLYEEIRSSFAHQYDPGERADAWPMTSCRDDPASYVNILGKPRRIHFHIEWIAEVAIRAAKYVDNLPPPQPDPDKWWADG